MCVSTKNVKPSPVIPVSTFFPTGDIMIDCREVPLFDGLPMYLVGYWLEISENSPACSVPYLRRTKHVHAIGADNTRYFKWFHAKNRVSPGCGPLLHYDRNRLGLAISTWRFCKKGGDWYLLFHTHQITCIHHCRTRAWEILFDVFCVDPFIKGSASFWLLCDGKFVRVNCLLWDHLLCLSDLLPNRICQIVL